MDMDMDMALYMVDPMEAMDIPVIAMDMDIKAVMDIPIIMDMADASADAVADADASADADAHRSYGQEYAG